MTISLIVAASENNVIGRDGELPWDLPDDLQFFKDKTSGHPIIMGRKNYESIGRSLPGRTNIIITRQADYEAEGCTIVLSLDDALNISKEVEDDEIFIIGGGEIYRQSIEIADRIYLTRVHAKIEGDVYFPELGDEWEEVSSVKHEADERHEYAFTFKVFKKKK
ncbi:MAG: dihydrofolate reductase [Candidatus Peribacteraceae bacterium]|nr:dihydrofolate reductase [Candidatus Peribacteraceae bacterium]